MKGLSRCLNPSLISGGNTLDEIRPWYHEISNELTCHASKVLPVCLLQGKDFLFVSMPLLLKLGFQLSDIFLLQSIKRTSGREFKKKSLRNCRKEGVLDENKFRELKREQTWRRTLFMLENFGKRLSP